MKIKTLFSILIKMFLRIVLLCLAFSAVSTCGDFYWRNYDGIIPHDAIPAGKDLHGRLLYIGQGYIHDYGTFYGTIQPMKMNMTVACYGTKEATLIRILCARDHTKFYWLSITSHTYKNRTADICPVSGGYDQRSAEIHHLELGPLHVGRTRVRGDAIIGQIAEYNEEVHHDVYFYYPYQGKQFTVTSDFEVLVYSDVPLALYTAPQQEYVIPVV